MQEYGALTLFSGDAFNPSIMSNVTRGEQMPPVLNACGVAAACVGNHDLDFGRARLAELAAQCDFPWLMANVLDKHTGDVFEGVQRYVFLGYAQCPATPGVQVCVPRMLSTARSLLKSGRFHSRS